MRPNLALQRRACKEPQPACVPGVCGKSVNHPLPGRGFPVTFVPCLSRSLICRREAPHPRTLGGPCGYPNTFGTARLTNRRGKPRPHPIRYPTLSPYCHPERSEGSCFNATTTTVAVNSPHLCIRFVEPAPFSL